MEEKRANPAAPIRVPVLVGPTASGKTALVLRIAESDPRIEVISADSRQVYIGMDIGTAKPPKEIRDRIPHHLIDILTPDQAYSAGRFARDARAAIDAVLSRGHIPVVTGGTGFYVRALFEGLSAPAVDREIVAELERRAGTEGYEVIYEELKRVDPEAAEMHPKENRVKTFRALACWLQTGEKYSRFLQQEKESMQLRPMICTLLPERRELYERINDRVYEMFEQGLVLETESLLRAGFKSDDPGLITVGYREVIAMIQGRMSPHEVIPAVQQSTRRYAKRQMTWFGNQLTGDRVVRSPEEGEEWLRGLLLPVE